MPYFPGYTFVDRAGTVITSAGGQIIKEADRPVSSFIGQYLGPDGSLAGLLNSILGLSPDSAIGAVLLDLAALIPGVGQFIDQVTSQQLFSRVTDTRLRLIDLAAGYSLTDVLAAIGGIGGGGGEGGVPIVITPTQLGDIGAAVWDYTPGDSWTAFEYQRMAGVGAYNLAQNGVIRLPSSNGMGIVGRLAEPASLTVTPGEWYIDWSDLQANDSPLSFVSRQFPLQTWTALTGLDWPSTPYVTVGAFEQAWVVFPYSQADLNLLKLTAGIQITGGAPVWPGVEEAILGEPVALSALTTVEGPLSGVLVNITTPPTTLSEVAIGGKTFYFRLGTITFESDRGDSEVSQYLQFQDAVYCPKAMALAQAAHIAVHPAAQGTVTPFTVAG